MHNDISKTGDYEVRNLLTVQKASLSYATTNTEYLARNRLTRSPLGLPLTCRVEDVVTSGSRMN